MLFSGNNAILHNVFYYAVKVFSGMFIGYPIWYNLYGSVLFLFAITAAGVVPCGGPKQFPCTSSIVQIIFSFWSFEISGGILRNQNIINGLDSFSKKYLIFCTHLYFTSLCNDYPIEKRYKLAKIRKRRNQKKIPTLKTEVGNIQTNNQVLIS